MENIFEVILVGRLDEQGLPQTGIVLVSKASIDKNLKREPLFGNGKKHHIQPSAVMVETSREGVQFSLCQNRPVPLCFLAKHQH